MATQLDFDDIGSGPPLVLLHGFPLDRGIWADAAPLLAKRFRVLTVDLPGFGRSPPDTKPMSMRSLAESIHQFLLERGIRRYALGGLSMGGYVAQEYARRFGDELDALLLINTKSAADTAEARRGRDDMAALACSAGAAAVADQMFPKMITPETIHQRPALAARVRTILEQCPPDTIAAACLAMRDRDDFTATLAAYPFPVLILTGAADAIATPTIAESMVAPLKHGRLAVIHAAAHLSPLEQPEAFAAAVLDFFSTSALRPAAPRS